MKFNVVIGLLGLIAGLLIALAVGTDSRSAFAAGGITDGSMVAVTTNHRNGQEELVWVLDTKARRLTCYKYKNNLIELIGARDVEFDLLLRDFLYQGKHVTPKEVERELKKKHSQKKNP